jgi:type IV pilus assembly protein PilV
MVRSMRNEKGSSLIEVVVALFVLAIGMLGVLSMQLKSMQFNQSAYYYSQATFLANEILENMRSNPSVAETYLIEFDEDAPTVAKICDAQNVTCSPSELRAYNLSQWRTNIENTLSGGKSSIQRTGEFYAITVQFDDRRSEHDGDGEAVLSEYVLVTEIN